MISYGYSKKKTTQPPFCYTPGKSGIALLAFPGAVPSQYVAGPLAPSFTQDLLDWLIQTDLRIDPVDASDLDTKGRLIRTSLGDPLGAHPRGSGHGLALPPFSLFLRCDIFCNLSPAPHSLDFMSDRGHYPPYHLGYD